VQNADFGISRHSMDNPTSKSVHLTANQYIDLQANALVLELDRPLVLIILKE
jgi:hypothetical protein